MLLSVSYDLFPVFCLCSLYDKIPKIVKTSHNWDSVLERMCQQFGTCADIKDTVQNSHLPPFPPCPYIQRFSEECVDFLVDPWDAVKARGLLLSNMVSSF